MSKTKHHHSGKAARLKEDEVLKKFLDTVDRSDGFDQFKDDGGLAKFLNSADPKELAKSIDKNLKNYHITLPDKNQKERKYGRVDEHFSKDIVEKLEKVGEELERIIAHKSQKSNLVERVGHGISRVFGAFKGLLGKKVDNPFLEEACKECNDAGFLTQLLVLKDSKADKLNVFAHEILEAQIAKSPKKKLLSKELNEKDWFKERIAKENLLRRLDSGGRSK